jgi:hypothetical protein
MVYQHKKDVVAIQESKKEECSKRFQESLTTQINWWITQPSNGSSGREFLGVDDSNFDILGHSILFLLTFKTKLIAKLGSLQVFMDQLVMRSETPSGLSLEALELCGMVPG